MALDEARLKKLQRMQHVLALEDPSALELDLTDEDDARAIDFDYHFGRMLEYGEPFKFYFSEHEWFEVKRVSNDVFEGPRYDLRHISRDRRLCPEAEAILNALEAQTSCEEVTRYVESDSHQ